MEKRKMGKAEKQSRETTTFNTENTDYLIFDGNRQQ
jgi:hypothetical protein